MPEYPYGIRLPRKYWTEGFTHLSWLHELRIVKVAGLGAGSSIIHTLSGRCRFAHDFDLTHYDPQRIFAKRLPEMEIGRLPPK